MTLLKGNYVASSSPDNYRDTIELLLRRTLVRSVTQ